MRKRRGERGGKEGKRETETETLAMWSKVLNLSFSCLSLPSGGITGNAPPWHTSQVMFKGLSRGQVRI